MVNRHAQKLTFTQAAQLGLYTVCCARCGMSEDVVGTDDWSCRRCGALHRIDPLVLTYELAHPYNADEWKTAASIYAVATPLIDVADHPLHDAPVGASNIILPPWRS